MDSELHRFKMAINLTEVAASRGYELDRRESSQRSAVMRHPNGDKVVIARQEGSGDWIFFSVRDYQDNGSVIDFVQRRDGGTLGDVRKTLRAWLGDARPRPPLPHYVADLLPISRDRAAVLAAWEQASPCAGLPYLASRGITADLLALPRFAGRVRVDARRNALFPHYDREGLCGYEMKNQGFTSFAPQGVKGLWYSVAHTTDGELVLAESALDAYSYHALQGGQWTRYMSTGGSLNTQQPALLRGAMERLPAGAVVVLAFDHDEGGEALAEQVRAVAPAGREVRRVLPPVGEGKDWNEALQRRLGLT